MTSMAVEEDLPATVCKRKCGDGQFREDDQEGSVQVKILKSGANATGNGKGNGGWELAYAGIPRGKRRAEARRIVSKANEESTRDRETSHVSGDGPIGGAGYIPGEFRAMLSPQARLFERLRDLNSWWAARGKAFRECISQTHVVFAANEETKNFLKPFRGDKTLVQLPIASISEEKAATFKRPEEMDMSEGPLRLFAAPPRRSGQLPRSGPDRFRPRFSGPERSGSGAPLHPTVDLEFRAGYRHVSARFVHHEVQSQDQRTAGGTAGFRRRPSPAAAGARPGRPRADA